MLVIFGFMDELGTGLLWLIGCFVVDFLGVVSVVNDCGLMVSLFWWLMG